MNKPTMKLCDVSVRPKRAETIEEARTLVAQDGAAVVSGLRTVQEVAGYGVAFLAGDGVLVRPQFSTASDDRNYRPSVPREIPDERGRVVSTNRMNENLLVHNDGKTFGDMSPDYILLWAEVVCPFGGDSVLIDGGRLLELLCGHREYRDLVDLCWNIPIDVSEAYHQLPEPSPIARQTQSGRHQVRCHLNLRALEGPEELKQQHLIDQWIGVVRQADAEAETFRVEVEEMLVIDNYRLLHGRRAYVTPGRRMTSVWAWSNQAFAVPSSEPDFDRPEALLIRY
jgi:hypothetical protein